MDNNRKKPPLKLKLMLNGLKRKNSLLSKLKKTREKNKINKAKRLSRKIIIPKYKKLIINKYLVSEQSRNPNKSGKSNPLTMLKREKKDKRLFSIKMTSPPFDRYI